MEIIEREQARSEGKIHYYTGKPCKYGHDCPRLVSTTRCTQCIKEYKTKNSEREKLYRDNYRKENADHLKTQAKKRLEKISEERYKEKIKNKPQRDLEKKERKRLSDKNYRLNNKEKRKQWHKDYFSIGNPGFYLNKMAQHKRRLRILEQGGTFTLVEIKYMENFYNNKCPVCGESIKNGYDIDHVLPISKGGDNFATNLQLLCASCNRSKNATLMEEWVKDPIVYQKWALQRFLMLVGLLYENCKDS